MCLLVDIADIVLNDYRVLQSEHCPWSLKTKIILKKIMTKNKQQQNNKITTTIIPMIIIIIIRKK